MNCHAADAKKVGPSFKDIAAKGATTDAQVAKLKEGKGHMKVNASDAEIKEMLQAIAAMK
jgi:cytochrome c551/c552